MKLKELKKEEWFTRKPISEPKENQVWIRGEYVRSEKKYICTNFSDINRELLLKGECEVYTDFIF